MLLILAIHNDLIGSLTTAYCPIKVSKDTKEKSKRPHVKSAYMLWLEAERKVRHTTLFYIHSRNSKICLANAGGFLLLIGHFKFSLFILFYFLFHFSFSFSFFLQFTYLFYLKSLKSRFPGAAPKELLQKAGEIWRAMNEEEKKVSIHISICVGYINE